MCKSARIHYPSPWYDLTFALIQRSLPVLLVLNLVWKSIFWSRPLEKWPIGLPYQHQVHVLTPLPALHTLKSCKGWVCNQCMFFTICNVSSHLIQRVKQPQDLQKWAKAVPLRGRTFWTSERVSSCRTDLLLHGIIRCSSHKSTETTTLTTPDSLTNAQTRWQTSSVWTPRDMSPEVCLKTCSWYQTNPTYEGKKS